MATLVVSRHLPAEPTYLGLTYFENQDAVSDNLLQTDYNYDDLSR